MAYIIRRRRLGKTSCEEISKKTKNNITVVRNDEVLPLNDQLCFRWGCTSTIPQQKVVNQARYIHYVNNKSEFRKVLNEKGLCPKTWWLENLDQIQFPVIFRPAFHAQGRNLEVHSDMDGMRKSIEKYAPHFYVSEIIDKIEEFRVFIAQGRVVCVAKKTPGNPEDIAWNVARGGRFDNVRWNNWNLNAVEVSIEAFYLSGLDFGGVDVIIDGGGDAYVLEINSAPSLTSEYRQKCFAKAFDYIVDNNKNRIPIEPSERDYKKFIHPAVCERAL